MDSPGYLSISTWFTPLMVGRKQNWFFSLLFERTRSHVQMFSRCGSAPHEDRNQAQLLIIMQTHVFAHVNTLTAACRKRRLRLWASPRLLNQLYHLHWLLTDFNYDSQELIWLLAVYPFLLPSMKANYAWVAVDEQWTLLMALCFSLCVHITEGYGLWNEITTDYCAISDCAIKHYGPEHSKLCDCGVAGCLLL